VVEKAESLDEQQIERECSKVSVVQLVRAVEIRNKSQNVLNLEQE